MYLKIPKNEEETVRRRVALKHFQAFLRYLFAFYAKISSESNRQFAALKIRMNSKAESLPSNLRMDKAMEKNHINV